jgi:DNA-binding NarL/FixJ family response regulator
MEQNEIIRAGINEIKKLNSLLAITNKILGIDFRKLHIIYLDDHRIFRRGMEVEIKKKLPNVFLKEFVQNEQALIYIEESLKNKKPIDLVITDYNHPGPNGLIFAKAVREFQSYYSTKFPIVLITMCIEDEFLIKAVREDIFDAYFPKFVEAELVINFIKNHT